MSTTTREDELIMNAFRARSTNMPAYPKKIVRNYPGDKYGGVGKYVPYDPPATLEEYSKTLRDKPFNGTTPYSKPATLCLMCAKACGGSNCEWANELRPVPGWDIVVSGRNSTDPGNPLICTVRECPKYVRGRRMEYLEDLGVVDSAGNILITEDEICEKYNIPTRKEDLEVARALEEDMKRLKKAKTDLSQADNMSV